MIEYKQHFVEWNNCSVGSVVFVIHNEKVVKGIVTSNEDVSGHGSSYYVITLDTIPCTTFYTFFKTEKEAKLYLIEYFNNKVKDLTNELFKYRQEIENNKPEMLFSEFLKENKAYDKFIKDMRYVNQVSNINLVSTLNINNFCHYVSNLCDIIDLGYWEFLCVKEQNLEEYYKIVYDMDWLLDEIKGRR